MTIMYINDRIFVYIFSSNYFDVNIIKGSKKFELFEKLNNYYVQKYETLTNILDV